MSLNVPLEKRCIDCEYTGKVLKWQELVQQRRGLQSHQRRSNFDNHILCQWKYRVINIDLLVGIPVAENHTF